MLTAKQIHRRVRQAAGKKVSLDNVYLIGLNCGGTMHPLVTRRMAEEIYKVDADAVIGEEIAKGELILKTASGEKGIKIDEKVEKL